MITKAERIILASDFATVERLWNLRSSIEPRKLSNDELMARAGYEEVAATDGQLMLPDGREILFAYNKAWALLPDIHKERLAEKFADASKTKVIVEVKDVSGTEALSVLSCRKCGDMLQRSNVCPNCSIGKLGYKYRYYCVCGKSEFVSKEEL